MDLSAGRLQEWGWWRVVGKFRMRAAIEHGIGCVERDFGDGQRAWGGIVAVERTVGGVSRGTLSKRKSKQTDRKVILFE